MPRVKTSWLKIDEIDESISSIQASKSQKRDFRDFSGAKLCYSNRNVKFENIMYIEWREEKFLKGICGSPNQAMLLKQASNDRSFAYAASKL